MEAKRQNSMKAVSIVGVAVVAFILVGGTPKA